MCLAIYKPKGVQIARKHLKSGFDNNVDGAGFAICRNNTIEIYKGYFKFDEFYDRYNELQRYPALIHFRIATHGIVNAQNCHPFEICDGQFALSHNGVMPVGLEPPIDESDTAYFAREIMEPILNKM